MVKVSEMMAAIVQEQDVDGTIKALSKMDVPVTRLASSGGFLGRKNSTLLIGVNKQILDEVIKALQNSCKQRVEYLAIPLEG